MGKTHGKSPHGSKTLGTADPFAEHLSLRIIGKDNHVSLQTIVLASKRFHANIQHDLVFILMVDNLFMTKHLAAIDPIEQILKERRPDQMILNTPFRLGDAENLRGPHDCKQQSRRCDPPKEHRLEWSS